MKTILTALSLVALSTGAFAVDGTIFGTHVCHLQGPTRLGGPVPPERSVVERMNGEPQRSDVWAAPFNAFSLGKRGFAKLRFDVAIAPNPAGPDFKVWETTYLIEAENPNSERAEVFVSQDGTNYTSLGINARDSNWELPMGWEFATHVMVADRTNPNPAATNDDGNDFFDLDGVEGYVGYVQLAASPCGVIQKFCKDGSPVHPLRSQVFKAYVPQMSDAGFINFFTLGFGGEICFNMGRQVFDEPGAEVAVYETTFQNQPCPNYPETVEVYASADNVSWTDLGPLCKDGSVDFNGLIVNAQFLRLVDISDPALFSSPKADGYDIDGIVVRPATPANVDCGPPPRRAISFENKFNDDSNIPESMPTLNVIGNPVSSTLKVQFTIGEAEGIDLIVRNYMGQEVSRIHHNGELYSVDEVSLPMDNMASGVYFVTLEGQTYKEVAKFVKN